MKNVEMNSDFLLKDNKKKIEEILKLKEEKKMR